MPSISACSAASLDSRSGAKPPSSPTAVLMPALAERLLERVEDLRARAQALRERRRADRHDHELLEVDRVVGVGAAVEHVHHRHRQHVRRLAAQVAPQRQVLLGRGRARGGQRHAEDRVGAQARLVGRAVEVDQRAVEPALVERVEARHRLGDLAVDVGDRLRDALAAPGVPAVAQLRGLELAGRGPGRHRGAALRARSAARGRPPRSGCRASRGSGGRGSCRSGSRLGLLVQAGPRVVAELLVGAEIVPVGAVRCGQARGALARGRGSGRRRPAARAPGRP